jgi:hypothetical protein
MQNNDFMYQTDFESGKDIKRVELSPKRVDICLKYEKNHSNSVRVPKMITHKRKISDGEFRKKEKHLPTIFRNPVIPVTSVSQSHRQNIIRKRLQKHCHSLYQPTLYPRNLKYSLILDNFYLSST